VKRDPESRVFLKEIFTFWDIAFDPKAGLVAYFSGKLESIVQCSILKYCF
jgi:hypothetical protein